MQIGQGTYSNVYKARDLQSGKIVALKRVRFVNMDPESVRFMAREIHILRRLDHPNVIKLEGIVTSRLSHSLPRRPRCTLRPALPTRWPTHPLDLDLAAAHLPKLGSDLAL